MAEEKIINRDIIYVCIDGFDNELDNSMKNFFPDIEKKSDSNNEGSRVINSLKTVGTILALPVIPIVGFISGFLSAIESSHDDAIQFLPIKYIEKSFKHDAFETKGISNFSVGMILVKHPFIKNTYININSLEKESLHYKLICLSTIAQYLGAKTISGYATIADEQKRIHSISGEVIYKAVDGKIQIKTDENQRYESKYSLEDTFSGELTSETYKQAKEEATKYGLNEDIEIQNLIEQRNPEHSTSITSRKITIELSREYNKVLDIAFSLDIPEMKLSAEYKSILESRKTILFNMEIKF